MSSFLSDSHAHQQDLHNDSSQDQQRSQLSLLSRAPGNFSSKVTTVLSTSYTDSEFRRTLSFLDEQRVRNDAGTRRRLRLQLQKEVIDNNTAIINDFARVAEHLRHMGSAINSLNKDFQILKCRLSAVNNEANTGLQEARSLMSKKSDTETRQHVLSAFRARFLLTHDEVASLTLVAEPVDERFFAALSRAKCIIKDCEILLGFETQTLGHELMGHVLKSLSIAYQKLYKWTQREFKILNLENPQINSSIRKALRVLAERPSLFQSCLSSFAVARERILSDSLLMALSGATSPNVNDSPVKPIDMTAHDSLRYMGDMLAWVHSAAVSEQEALGFLFMSEKDGIVKGLESGKEAELWHLAIDDDSDHDAMEFDADKALSELVDRDLSGVARVLRPRMGQVIQTNEEVILAYKLANLLGFYTATFTKLLSGSSVLTGTISNAEAEAFRQFYSLVRDRLAGLQADFHKPPDDLRPPTFLQEALEQLSTIMQTYDTSFSTSADREADFQPILNEVFEPFMVGCTNVAQNLHSPTNSIFLVNCYLACISTLWSFGFTKNKIALLRDAVSKETKNLTSAQYQFIRNGSGLDVIFGIIENASLAEGSAEQLRKIYYFQPDVLQRTGQLLDDFLPSALMDAMDNIKQLQDSTLARQITEEAAEKFCCDFACLEDHISRLDRLQAEGDGDAVVLKNVFPRTTGEVKVLLS